MFFSVDLANLILYCAQQFGMALGFGAQAIMLVAYAGAMKDGVIDPKEAQFLRATRRTLAAAFIFICISGLGISLLHMLAGQAAILVTPAYLFKWLLIVVVITMTRLIHSLPETIAEGVLGGTWAALFLVHILAPLTSWTNLFIMWAVLLVGFNIVWYAIIFTSREKKAAGALVTVTGQPSFEAAVMAKPLAAPVPQIPRQVIQPEVKQEIKTERPKIVIDPVRVTLPPTVPQTVSMPQRIVIQPPVKSAPAGITTDTPFLPQVPPLQPIPTIPPGTVPPAPAAIPIAQSAVEVPPNFVPATPPPAPAVPEAPADRKLALNIMPKSADQIK